MMIPLLFFLVTLEPQQPLEQQLQRQQQQLQQIQQELREQQLQIQHFAEVLERTPQRPVCSVELRWVNGAEARAAPRTVTAVVQLNLFSTVSEPVNGCLPAEIRVTASFLDAVDNLICSGAVEDIAIQNTLTQSINLEVRPWDFSQFVRWRNEPPQVNSGFKRLICLNPEGVAEAASGEMEKIAGLRVRATVLPRGGGVSTAEIRLNRNPR
jgi:hypothetical protein